VFINNLRAFLEYDKGWFLIFFLMNENILRYFFNF
jgi:hypothetical protein